MAETRGRSPARLPGGTVNLAGALPVCETQDTAFTLSRGYLPHDHEFLGPGAARDLRLRGVSASSRPRAHLRADGALHGSRDPMPQHPPSGRHPEYPDGHWDSYANREWNDPHQRVKPGP